MVAKLLEQAVGLFPMRNLRPIRIDVREHEGVIRADELRARPRHGFYDTVTQLLRVFSAMHMNANPKRTVIHNRRDKMRIKNGKTSLDLADVIAPVPNLNRKPPHALRKRRRQGNLAGFTRLKPTHLFRHQKGMSSHVVTICGDNPGDRMHQRIGDYQGWRHTSRNNRKARARLNGDT